MQKSGPSDTELLAEWLEHRREKAFHSLVSRYAGLVLMTAKRSCGDASMAAEASQLTFLLLARKARSLLSCASLGGWLHRATLMHSRNLLRTARRETRKRHSLQNLMAASSSSPAPGSWADLGPALDESLAALSGADREAILLRYYRALSVREVAGTLGIAPDAAQKRIERATFRLRGQLNRRGWEAGGSLAAVMLAGFAADVKAAAPAVTALAAEVSAAGAQPAAGFPATVAVKAASKYAPLAAVVVAGVWVIAQRHAIARLEEESLVVRARLQSPPRSGAGLPAGSVWDRWPRDWPEIARQLRSGEGAGGYLNTTLAVEEGFLVMNREELIASLDEIEAAALAQRDRKALQWRLQAPLTELDPEYVARRFHSSDAVGLWAGRDPEGTVAWFKEQIASGGAFEGENDPDMRVRSSIMSALTYALVSPRPELACEVLETVPENARLGSLEGGARALRDRRAPENWAQLLRRCLPEKDRLEAITWPVSDLGEGGTIGLDEFESYLNRIGAAPEERRACILAVAGSSCFPREGGFFKTTPQDLEGFLSWVRLQDPALLFPATAAALEEDLAQLSYAAAAELARRYHAEGGGDQVLLPVLESSHAWDHKELAVPLAEKLSDAARREEILKQLRR